MFNRRSLLILPLLGLTLAACDDSTGPETQQLTASEAAAIAVALDNSSSTAVEEETSEEPSFALLPSNGASQDVITRTDAFNVNLPCPRGGTANLDGDLAIEINGDEGFITLDLTASQSHAACAFRTNEGVDITVDGTLDFVAARELREGLASASQSHSGSLDYVTTDGKEGTCAIDIATAFSLTSGEATRSIVGSVCGHAVDVETSWTFTQT